MSETTDITSTFGKILGGVTEYVGETYGDEASHRLFFELYSAIFSHLDREFGAAAPELYWDYIANHHMDEFERLVATKGLAGMAEYWSDVGKQEGAEFETELGTDHFEIRVRTCPPTEWFAERGIAKYEQYSEHCRVLYSTVAERHGFDATYCSPDKQAGHCCVLKFTLSPKE